MANESRVCPSCNAENNPSFTQCWKCRLIFNTGETASPQILKAGKQNWLWPEMNSLANAERATEYAFVAAMFSSAITGLVSLLAFFGKSFYGFSPNNFSEAVLMLALGFGIKRKSRASALILLIYFTIGKALSLGGNSNNTSSTFVSSIIWILFFLNGVRGAFAYHKLNNTLVSHKNLILKTGMALLYGGIVFFLCSMLYVSHFENFPYAMLFFIPTLIIIWFSFLGWLPFTKGSVVMPNPVRS